VTIGKRLLDLARANLNALLEKAAGDTPVGEMTDEELELELERRRQKRQRELEESKGRESAERAARERAQKRGAEPRKPPPRAREAQGRTRRPPVPGGEKHLRELYAQLEVPYGAPFQEVKASFRRLMRKYHPDLHVNNPVKHKAATQLTMTLTAAYNELEQHLTKK
jgi:DnaJ-domain-containing protein 1